MYSDAEIDEAVKAGALAPEAAAAFRAHVARQRSAPVGDEEHVRLVTSFNDIFVTAAAVLVLAGAGWIAASLDTAPGGAVVAVASWVLAEYFTRRRRMALPSIVLLLTFAGSVFWTAWTLLPGSGDAPAFGQAAAMAGVAAAGAAWLHWRRFRVPATVAAGAAALVFAILCLVFDRTPDRHVMDAVLAAMFLSGAGVFALAMRWDLSRPGPRDRALRTSPSGCTCSPRRCSSIRCEAAGSLFRLVMCRKAAATSAGAFTCTERRSSRLQRRVRSSRASMNSSVARTAASCARIALADPGPPSSASSETDFGADSVMSSPGRCSCSPSRSRPSRMSVPGT